MTPRPARSQSRPAATEKAKLVALVRALACQAAREAHRVAAARNPTPIEVTLQPKLVAGERRRFLTVRQVAEQVHHSERQVRRWIAAGDLAVHYFGRSVRIASPDLDAFIATRRRAGG